MTLIRHESKQLQASGSDQYPQFQAENTEVVGISMNAPCSHKKPSPTLLKIVYPLLRRSRRQESCRLSGFTTNPDVWQNGRYIIIDKAGVIKYYDIRPSNTEKDFALDRAIVKRGEESQSRQLNDRRLKFERRKHESTVSTIGAIPHSHRCGAVHRYRLCYDRWSSPTEHQGSFDRRPGGSACKDVGNRKRVIRYLGR